MGNKLEIKVLSSGEPCVTSTTIVDVEATAGRYELHVTFFPKTKTYMLTVVNWGIFLITQSPNSNPGFYHALLERGVSRPDAEAIQYIVNEILLPDIRKKTK